MNIAYEIERLIDFGYEKKLLEKDDVIPARNALLDFLRVLEPYAFGEDEAPPETPATARDILDNIADYAAGIGIIVNDTPVTRDLLDARVMGMITPRASEVISRFQAMAAVSPRLATEYFYTLSRDVNYIQVDRVARNLYWRTETDVGDLEITVNLSKPEKDPKDIAAAQSAPQSGYPKCLLCKENAGYAGHAAHPARQNLRLVPMRLDGEEWYFQYSPYVYYNEHCIVLNKRHEPMAITDGTFRRLFAFVEQLPHYFIGSNADLPIVGGSILTHDHFQGGWHVFPMEMADVCARYAHPAYPDVTAALVEWPISTIRLTNADESRDASALCSLSSRILSAWREYGDEKLGIFPFSGGTPHNTVTPIARVNGRGHLEIDLALRNNRTDAERPMGIFHPRNAYHHIKRENIGLIEVMGLAVLPARLENTIARVAAMLSGGEAYLAGSVAADPELAAHADWIAGIIGRYGAALGAEEAEDAVKREIGLVFRDVLSDCGVFKLTDEGRGRFAAFMDSMGFVPADLL
ncbi:MAG: UDP-glucose--hexose-1-phosphate uridylyltransferase [Clostridiales bacterium]|jgi:UDPglucose--hexose-1-phosphate uridylyltransferase|nr:UDP-glucose--hexose-1-phosphate uridylyltransferase [Clostridiales bacterium]